MHNVMHINGYQAVKNVRSINNSQHCNNLINFKFFVPNISCVDAEEKKYNVNVRKT